MPGVAREVATVLREPQHAASLQRLEHPIAEVADYTRLSAVLATLKAQVRS
jgi:hypothetical protein